MSALISICIPVFNCEAYIAQTLHCLLAQTYTDIELIIFDDGSSDRSKSIIESFNDKRIVLESVRNSGASAARNLAYKKSRGEFVVFFDADDYVEPVFLELQYNKVKDSRDVVVLADWGRFYNNDVGTLEHNSSAINDITFNEWIKMYWLNGNPMTNPGRALIPRSLIETAGLWNEELSLNDDMEFFTRIFFASKKIVFNHDAVLFYRSGINGLSSAQGCMAYLSLFNSTSLSVDYVLDRYEHDDCLLKSCANIFQLFAYTTYPNCPELVSKAEIRIKALGGADLQFPAGRITRMITCLAGWKNAKKVRSWFY